MKKFLWLFLVCCISTVQAKILFLANQPVNVSTGIKPWSQHIKSNAVRELIQLRNDKNGYTECRPTKALSNVILCGSYLQRDMNQFLLRAAMFSEGGIGRHQKGELVPITDKYIAAHLDVIGGHDIESKDLLAFYQQVKQHCSTHEEYCLTDNEASFHAAVITPLENRHAPFVIISFSVQSAARPEEVVSHEYIHAKYFLDSDYHAQITAYWNQVLNTQQRAEIRHKLQEIGYNAANEDLMRNEFQAYILMDYAEDSLLSSLTPHYRKQLQAFLLT